MNPINRLLQPFGIAIRRTGPRPDPFGGTEIYWERRYRRGGDSGEGSYGRLSRFKADVMNRFFDREGIDSVVEWGCGDGNQLSLLRVQDYVGIDVSGTIIESCRQRFTDDPSRRFFHASDPAASRITADCAISLDVIYHLIEDEAFLSYMASLFSSADSWVVIYSSNNTPAALAPEHIRHRPFTDWVRCNRPDWELEAVLPNRYPRGLGDGGETSFADFYFFRKS